MSAEQDNHSSHFSQHDVGFLVPGLWSARSVSASGGHLHFDLRPQHHSKSRQFNLVLALEKFAILELGNSCQGNEGMMKDGLQACRLAL